MINFFTPEEEQKIIAAIRQAESATSGEIRVHLEENPKGTALKEAERIFHKLGMHKTQERNGVLIILLPEKKEFAIIGDKGINELVEADFWDNERDLMQRHFQDGRFCAGLVAVIDQIGEKLKSFFPHQECDENELPDDISYGNDNS